MAYASGQPLFNITDLTSEAFGTTWNQTRSYDPIAGGTGPLGNHWMLNQTPYLEDAAGVPGTPAGATDTVVENASGSDARIFDLVNGVWVERFGHEDALAQGTDTDGTPIFILTDSTGGVTKFYDFTSGNDPGIFRSYTATNGVTTQVTSMDSEGNITEIQESQGSDVASWVYSYMTNPADSNKVLLSSTLQRQSTDGGSTWTNVQEADYSYYDGSLSGNMAYGNQNDLRTAAITDPNAALSASLSYSYDSGSNTTTVTATALGNTYVNGDTIVIAGAGQQGADGTWVISSVSGGSFQYTVNGNLTNGGSVTTDAAHSNKPLDVSFYRYFTPNNDGGYGNRDGLLQFLVGSDSYARARGAGVDPATASDATMASYADNQFDYDGFERVADEYVAGGTQHFQYNYFQNSSSGSGSGYNDWTTGTQVIQPGGSVETVYTDAQGLVMLDVIADAAGQQWATFYKYDDAGRLIMQADPSAASLPADFRTTVDPSTGDVTAGEDQSYPDLLDDTGGSYAFLNDNSGLIYDLDFYSVGWQFAGNGGITANDSGLAGTLSAPAGTEAAYLTGTASMTQALDVTAGTGSLTLSFEAAQGAGSSGQGIQVLVDGALLTFGGSDEVTPGSSYSTYTTDAFTLAAGTHTIQFVGESDSDAALIDAVSISGTGAPAVQDASFESASLASGMTVQGPAGSTATATTAGGVTGYFEDFKIQNGQDGTPIVQESQDYYAHNNGSTSLPALIYQLASTTTYANTDGTGARVTRYSYTYFANSNAAQSQTVILPPITASQNGPATSTTDTADGDTTVDVFNALGQVIWTKDGDGYLTYTAYDALTGAVVKQIADVNTADTSEFAALPSGWSTPSGGGLNLVTAYEVDHQGRVTKETDPAGNVTYTVYDDADHEIRVYAGWHEVGSTWTTIGPIQVSREYLPGPDASAGQQALYNESLTSSATPTSVGGVPTAQETIDASNIQSLSRSITNDAGQIVEEDDYFSLAGVTYSQAQTYLGSTSNNSASGNYSSTLYGYNSSGLLDHTIDPTGTITDLTYDGLGRLVSRWVGTNDTTANNMVDVADEQYDDGGVGDSDATEMVEHPGGGAADRVMLNLYDWRDRPIAIKDGALLDGSGNPDPSGETDGAHRLINYISYDNIGEVTAARTYAGDDVDLNDFADWTLSTDASDLRAYSTQSYDDQGRVFLAQTYSVDPTGGTVGASLATNYYYDHRGNAIEESNPDGQVTKHSYDGAGRDVKDSTTDGGVINGASATWASATTTATDVVIEQTLNTYDADGNLIEIVDKQRFDNDSTSSTGDLGGPSSGIHSRNYYTAYYYDAANRQTDSVNVGTNGGSAWTRPASVPADSDTVLVTHTDYDAAGNVADTIDPRGIENATFYDLMGRRTKTVAAWDGTTSATPTNDTNQTTTYTYDGSDHMLTMTAVMPTGTPSQTTAYVYGVTTSSGSNIFSNDLLATTEYPDPTTGAASTASANEETSWYNALGQPIVYYDRNGDQHLYSYDSLGRLTQDFVGWWGFGSGVSQQTSGLGYSYNDAGLPFQQTSYSGTYQGTVENQVEDLYNGYGQLIRQYQESVGAVNTGTSGSVQYGYSQPTGANYSRLTSMTYANGRVLDYGYNSGIDTAISRVSYQADDGGSSAGIHLADYTYLGLGTIVQEANPEASVELTYIQVPGDTQYNSDGGDRYTGLDRFGRVIDQAYYVTTSPPASPQFADRLQYGYDRDGNVLYENNLVNSSFSELYHANSSSSGDSNSAYDPLGRITSFSRGTLSSSGNNGSTLDTITSANLNSTSGVPNQNSWNLDALGNWTSGNGSSNTFNAQNEETANGSNTLAYDNAGNMTTDESGDTYVYDAWGHAISINDGSITRTFEFDALGRNDATNQGEIFTNYYSASGQLLQQSYGFTYTQYVWGLSYVNELVLRDRSTTYGTAGDLGITGSGLNEREYDQHNANFSTISYTNQTGTVQGRFAYDPYGAVVTITGAWVPTSSTSNDDSILFQGMRRIDGNAYLSQTRIYDVNLGRWISQDWAGYPDGLNRYSSFSGNPLTGVDPQGTCPCDDAQQLRDEADALNDTIHGEMENLHNLDRYRTNLRKAIWRDREGIKQLEDAMDSQADEEYNYKQINALLNSIISGSGTIASGITSTVGNWISVLTNFVGMPKLSTAAGYVTAHTYIVQQADIPILKGEVADNQIYIDQLEGMQMRERQRAWQLWDDMMLEEQDLYWVRPDFEDAANQLDADRSMLHRLDDEADEAQRECDGESD